MADSNSSIVGIVAVIAVVVLVGGFLYYMFTGERSETKVNVEMPEISAPESNGE